VISLAYYGPTDPNTKEKFLGTSHPDLYDFPVTPIVLEQGKKGLKWYKKDGESYTEVNLVDIK
jgi:hypothetical protein